jgi:hypothetical protein
MPGEPPLADPAEDVPADPPARHGILGLLLRRKRFLVITLLIAALDKLDDQSHRPLERMDVPRAATPNVHFRPTLRANPILSNQDNLSNPQWVHL